MICDGRGSSQHKIIARARSGVGNHAGRSGWQDERGQYASAWDRMDARAIQRNGVLLKRMLGSNNGEGGLLFSCCLFPTISPQLLYPAFVGRRWLLRFMLGNLDILTESFESFRYSYTDRPVCTAGPMKRGAQFMIILHMKTHFLLPTGCQRRFFTASSHRQIDSAD
jgi:hypothetical protein